MKVEPECAICLVSRAWKEIERATSDPLLRFSTMRAVVEAIARGFKPDAVPARLGTLRDRIVKSMSGVDPYARDKAELNRRALELLPAFEEHIATISDDEERFRIACLASIIGNTMEHDVRGHVLNLGALEGALLRERLAIDDVPRIFEIAERAKLAVFLADNAGEIAFDKLLVKELKKLGARVVVAVKSAPIIDDATVEDAEAVCMDRVADLVVTTGTDCVGLLLDEISDEMRQMLKRCDLIVAKGMGHYETFTELDGVLGKPVALLFRAKCNPVAKHVGVSRGSNVALLRRC